MLDAINSFFEMGMFVVILMGIYKLVQDKYVAGFHWAQVAFPMSWGMFNLVYYPSLGQTLSTVAAVFVVVANIVYLILITYYLQKGKK
jgi:hypothetical protein